MNKKFIHFWRKNLKKFVLFHTFLSYSNNNLLHNTFFKTILQTKKKMKLWQSFWHYLSTYTNDSHHVFAFQYAISRF